MPSFAMKCLHYFHLGKFSWLWERHHSAPAEEEMTSVSPCRVTNGKIRLWIPKMFPKQEARCPKAYAGESMDGQIFQNFEQFESVSEIPSCESWFYGLEMIWRGHLQVSRNASQFKM